jgi:outer membrane protein assembly factor BamB
MMNSLKFVKLLTGLIIVIFIISSFAAAQDGPKLLGAFFVKNKVGLKWTPVPGATEYIIYRQTNGADFVKITSTDKTNYFDTGISAGDKYVYKIAAVVNGAELEGSTKSVNIPASISLFSAPKDLIGREDSRGDGIALKWEKVSGAIAYNILRSTTQGSGYEVIGNTSNTKHVDKENMVRGTVYYYVVTAMNDEFEESPNSAEFSIKFGLSEEEIAALEEAQKTIFLDSIDLDLAFEITEADGTPMSNPTNFAFNTGGDIYIIDSNNKRIICTDSNGKPKFTFGNGMYEDQKDSPPDGAFLFPFAIDVDNKGNVYVTDVMVNDIQVFTADGKYVKRIRITLEGDQKPFRSNGLVVFDDGKILCSDVGNHRILILDNNGTILNQFNAGAKFLANYPNGVAMIDDETFVFANPVLGQVVISKMNGDVIKVFGQPGTDAGMFARPTGVWVDESGLIWVTDNMGATIQAFNQEGEVKIAFRDDKLIKDNAKILKPRGIVVKNGVIYVVNGATSKLLALNYQITKIDE